MKVECRNCDDRDRSSEDCSLMPRLPKLLLTIKAGIQALDERGPMMPFEAVALEIKYQDGNTPRQQLHAYNEAVVVCIEEHASVQDLNNVHRIY